jgi:hypothetical protein
MRDVFSKSITTFLLIAATYALLASVSYAQMPCVGVAENVQAASDWSEKTGQPVDIIVLHGDEDKFDKFVATLVAVAGPLPADWGTVSAIAVARARFPQGNMFSIVFFNGGGCQTGSASGRDPAMDAFFNKDESRLPQEPVIRPALFDYLPGKRSNI